ncbi:helix-turn-helix domain-containing protein [Dorea sp. D27]|uniref:helix-turn-helix domain-containing protein n=1 Tax=Dorea sp. D27 TaxID=658665 RepID=UPI0006730CD7|nr:helix-turn-helix transcriptional regulator [Dorea sp. D27]
MKNQFGKSLRSQMEKAGIKESELADALSYDATYISKWINGSKLPSERNAERIIGQMADCFAAHSRLPEEAEREVQRQQSLAELKMAYAGDRSYLIFQNYNNNEMSFADSRQTLIQLTRAAFVQALDLYDGRIRIAATFDLFRLYGKEFRSLMKGLNDAGVKKVELSLALEPEELVSDYNYYAAGITDTIGSFDYIEMSIVSRKPEQPSILVINDLLCLQVLWSLGGEISAVFSMEHKIISRFAAACQQITETGEKLLDPAEPESLRRTNVQLDSYSDRRQWQFFNEPPAMLFPEEIMDIFIGNAQDESYARYLVKLKNVFAKRTCKARIDLVLYSSMLNEYLTNGNISVGNVSHHLTPEQTRLHLTHLSKVMSENPDVRLYVIRDTVVLSEELRRAPSIFLDTYSLNIENSKKKPNDNYHISMDPRMRGAFEQFFERMLRKPFCNRLTAEDVLRYL